MMLSLVKVFQQWNTIYSIRGSATTIPAMARAINSSAQQVKADHAHCVALVQSRDREGYLCGLLMPSSAQRAYFALRAFNIELASVKDGNERRTSTVDASYSTIAMKVRMAWWRDVLNQLYGSEHQPAASLWRSPVVRALFRAVEEKQLTRRFLERLVDAREADLDILHIATMEDLMAYCEDSCSSLLYLSLECVGVRDEGADDVAGMMGVAWGITTAIRSTIFRAHNGEISIPADLLESTKIRPQYLIARLDENFEPKPEVENTLKESIQNMAFTASQQLSKAREMQGDVPKTGKSVLLHAIPTTFYLRKLQEANFDLWNPKLTSNDGQLVMLAMMGKAWWTGRI